MSRIILSLLLLCFTTSVLAQSVGIGVENPNNNAVLHLVSPNNNQGLLVPRMTTSQRTATSFTSSLGADDNGLLVFDGTLRQFFYWENNVWVPIQFGQDDDTDPQNEIQDLELNGSTLSISNNPNATQIDLSPFTGTDTDEQALDVFQLSGTILQISLERDNQAVRTVDLSPLNTDNQDLNFNAGVLSIDNGTTTVDFSGFDQNAADDFSGNWADLAGVPADIADGDDVLTEAEVDAFASNNGYLTTEVDGSITNEIQDLQLVGSTLSITNNPSATGIDLSPFSGVNTDEQRIDLLQLSGTTLQISLQNDGQTPRTVDLSSINTDNQDLNFNAGVLSIDNGSTTVDFSGFDQNAADDFSGNWSDLAGVPADIADGDDVLSEAEVDAFANNNGYLTTEVDGSTTNEIQDLQLVGTTLSITNNPSATDIDLSAFSGTNTDEQRIDLLQLNGTSLEISLQNDGQTPRTVDLSSINTDNQDLNFNAGVLSIDNGSTTVDFSGFDQNAADDFSGNWGDLAGVPADIADGDDVLTEAEVDAFANNNGYLTTEVDGSTTNEVQTITRVGDNVRLSINNSSASVRDFEPGAFKATTTNQYSIGGGFVDLLFDSELYDIGDTYDPGTGQFRANGDGIYDVKVTVTFNTNNLGPLFIFVDQYDVANNLIDRPCTRYLAGGERSVTVACDIQLQAGERLAISSFRTGDNTSTIAGGGQTFMSFSARRVY